jgi:Flp pilus assembly protein TadG
MLPRLAHGVGLWLSKTRASALSRQLRFLRAEDGAELVEFALSSLVLYILTFGFMQLCLVFFMFNTTAEVARETSRWASVRGTASSVTVNGVTSCANPNITECPATITQIQNFAMSSLAGSGGMNVQVWWCNADGQTNCVQTQGNATPGHVVKVNVSYTFANVPFVRNAPLAVSSTSEMVIWQ